MWYNEAMETLFSFVSKRVFLLIFLTALASTLLAGCSSGGQPVTGAERDQVLVYSEPKSDNLLAGLNANDYATFSRDMDDKMRGAMTQAAFENTRAQVTGKIGKYISRTVASVERNGDFMAVNYDARFEQEEGVTVRIVFNAGGAHTISGLWFNSPKLRQQ